MALEEGDPDTLKRHVVELLLQNPQGISFGDFSGGFHQLHGYHPRIALQGYRTLKALMADMKNIVVMEGNSLQQVMKIANGFLLDHGLEGEEGNELETSEGEVENLRDEDQVGGGTDLSAASVLIQDVLKPFHRGLKVAILEKTLKEKHGFDLKTFYSQQGYKNALSFLQNIPGLFFQDINKNQNCVVHFQPSSCSSAPLQPSISTSVDMQEVTSRPNKLEENVFESNPALAEILDLLISLLREYESGLGISKVQKLMLTKYAVDVEKFSIAQGYKDILEFLEHQISGLIIRYQEKTSEYVVQMPKALAEILDLLISLLREYESGLGISKVQKLMLTKYAVDVEKFSIAQGYKDILEFLEHQISGLIIRYQEKTSEYVVQMPKAISLPFTSVSVSNHVKKPTNQALDLSAASVLIQDVLRPFHHGLKVATLEKTLKEKHGFDLKTFYSQQGYKNALSFLQNIPGLFFQDINKNQNCVVHFQPSSCSSAPSQPSISTSVDMQEVASRPNKLEENVVESNPALAEILDLLISLLREYESGLRISKVQKLMLTKHAVDMERFSIAQGYKDILEFLEHQISGLIIRYQEKTSEYVVQMPKGLFGSDRSLDSDFSAWSSQSSTRTNSVGSYEPETKHWIQSCPFSKRNLRSSLCNPGRKTKQKKPQTHLQNGTTKKSPSVASVPPLMNAPAPQSAKTLEPVYSESGFGNVSKPSITPHDFSASKSQFQSLPVVAPFVPQEVKNMTQSSMRIPLPSFHEVRSASPAKTNNPCQSISNGPPQKPNVCQLGGPSPAEEMPCQLDRHRSSKSNMTKDESSEDQNDLKQQVAHILAMHPEGMSLFQFRAAYSATYQQHFPMGSTASAKQRLQEMPDVVCMINYGVQARLLPVSSAMSSLKSGQPVSSTVKKAPVVPGLSQPKTVSLTQENSEELRGEDSKEDFPFLDPLLHQVAKPRAPVQKDVKKNFKPMGVPVIPQSPVVSRTYAQVTASGEHLKPNSLHSKPTHLNSPYISANSASVSSHPNDSYISANSASVPSHPNDPYISANSASVPSHPNDPCISANSTSAPFTSNPASYNFGTWAQPVSYPPVMFVSQMPQISPVKPAYIQGSRYPSGIQFQNPVVQSSPFAQPSHVLPIRCDPTMYLTQSTEQQSYILTRPQVDAYSPMLKSSNVLQLAQTPPSSTGRCLVSPSSRNMLQTVQQRECYNHTQQYNLQRSSVVVMKKKFTVTSMDAKPKPPESAYQRQYVNWNSPAANTVPLISQGAWSTSQSFQPLETSSSSKWNPNALPSEPPVFMDQQQSISANTTVTTSVYSTPSLVDAPISPYSNHNNSAAQPSEPWTSIHQQQYTSLNTSIITSSRKQAGSPPFPQDLTIRPSRQVSVTPLSVRADYEPPDQTNPVVSFPKHVDGHRVSFPKNRTSCSPPNSPPPPPPKSSDKCVIL